MNEDEKPPKLQRSNYDTTASNLTLNGGFRRSSRNIGKVMDYSKELSVEPLRSAVHGAALENEGPLREGGKRIHNPLVP